MTKFQSVAKVNKYMNKPVVALAVILGILFILLSGLYAFNPAGSLPHFIPGYQAGLMKHHYTHAIGSFLVGLAVFAFAWFQSGKKSSK